MSAPSSCHREKFFASSVGNGNEKETAENSKTVYLPATFFAGINFPVLDMYARPALLRCFWSFLLERGTVVSEPCVGAADRVAILGLVCIWRLDVWAALFVCSVKVAVDVTVN